MERLRELNLIATGGLLPDKTFVIDCNPLVALTRNSSLPDRLEAEGVEFMNRVREGFLLFGCEEPERVFIIDGARNVSVIEEEIFQKVNTVLKRF
jgi:dTMP kinase